MILIAWTIESEDMDGHERIFRSKVHAYETMYGGDGDLAVCGKYAGNSHGFWYRPERMVNIQRWEGSESEIECKNCLRCL
jgi:hypothetical protein